MSPKTAATTLSIPPIFTLPFASFKNLARFAISLLFIASLTFFNAKFLAFFNPVFAFLRFSTFLMLGFFSIIGLMVLFILSITGLNIAFGFFTISFNWFIFAPIFLPQSNTPPFTLVARFFARLAFFAAHSVAPLYMSLPLSTALFTKFFPLPIRSLPLVNTFLPKFPMFLPIFFILPVILDMVLGIPFTLLTTVFFRFFTCDNFFLPNCLARSTIPTLLPVIFALGLPFTFPPFPVVTFGTFGFLWKNFLILFNVSPSFFIFL